MKSGETVKQFLWKQKKNHARVNHDMTQSMRSKGTIITLNVEFINLDLENFLTYCHEMKRLNYNLLKS